MFKSLFCLFRICLKNTVFGISRVLSIFVNKDHCFQQDSLASSVFLLPTLLTPSIELILSMPSFLIHLYPLLMEGAHHLLVISITYSTNNQRTPKLALTNLIIIKKNVVGQEWVSKTLLQV